MNQIERKPSIRIIEKENIAPKPPFWKQVFVTIITVYPLILGAELFLNFLFPMHLLEPKISIFFIVVIVATLMVYPVMPFVNKLLGNWLKR